MEENLTFSNNEINQTNLPQIQKLTFESLSPVYRKTNLVINSVVFLVLSCAYLLLKFQTFFHIPQKSIGIIIVILSVFVFLSLINIGFSFMADKRKGYALREQDISYTSGLIFKKIVTQPILRIQHVELKRGPIDRKVNLAKLQVFSAGGAMHTFEIPGLILDDAESIRQFILDHKDVKNNG